jgi:predicted AAA+ superfamily ATPase
MLKNKYLCFDLAKMEFDSGFVKLSIVERDVRQIKNINDLAIFQRFLKVCATRVGQIINYASIGNDCGIDQKTVVS